MKNIKIESKPLIKRNVRLMEVLKNNDNYELSFLVSSNRNFNISLTKKEFDIFKLINGTNSINEIVKLSNNSFNDIFQLLQKFDEKKVLTFSSQSNNFQFDYHDLFYDMSFKKNNFINEKIINKRILVVGTNEIANNVILLLMKMGIRDFVLVDKDIIEISNLSIPFLYDKEDVGKEKNNILKREILKFDKHANITLFNAEFNNNIFDKLSNTNSYKKIDFAIVTTSDPVTIAIDAYEIFTKLNIPYTTVCHLNDFSIFGPIIYRKNEMYEKYIETTKLKNRKPKEFIVQNKKHQLLSFDSMNMFSASNVISDMVRFFNDINSALSFEKKIIFNYNTFDKQEISFINTKTKIGIFTSSSDLSSKLPRRVNNSKKILEQEGYIVNLGNLWNKSIGYTSGNAKERSEEFNNLLSDNDILMSMIGGMNSSSILPYIDYDKIMERKTKIVGYSDTTAILLAVYKKTKIPTYYGPALLPSFDEQDFIKRWNLNSFNKYVVNNQIGIIDNPKLWTEEKIDWFNFEDEKVSKENYIKKMQKNKLYSYNDGVVIGRLIGGNLNTMVSVYNTEFMPEIVEGDILFIEDSNKSVDECERNFAFLKNSKILDKVSGVILGKSENFNKMSSNETYESLFMKFLDRKIPVLTNFDSSHCQPMNVLKIGGKVKLDTFNKQVTLLE
ncbi:LD-carboxypeptidase [Malacoplasma iowae]|uniref:LD-carboxypeptidase n=2 Tax=Malacoplasma iowae TaxID=2116 RepID=A0A6P1LEV8_MALIO|nr:LD-carboxypeptidase [Malacoplasma iowae]QHG90104.1 LD-carboxypeptidase [Malacoplasma iowae 695]WPL36157.1 LD-carboxypeptidase [Malacoplasma iowae]VEU61827.1 Murein tetrapeptide carboxypeptidase [Mycoplasmopsis fermentans]VEU70962.1 Murein tetrapeptide carboxypeptidase [Malacoplasma iowae]